MRYINDIVRIIASDLIFNGSFTNGITTNPYLNINIFFGLKKLRNILKNTTSSRNIISLFLFFFLKKGN